MRRMRSTPTSTSRNDPENGTARYSAARRGATGRQRPVAHRRGPCVRLRRTTSRCARDRQSGKSGRHRGRTGHPRVVRPTTHCSIVPTTCATACRDPPTITTWSLLESARDLRAAPPLPHDRRTAPSPAPIRSSGGRAASTAPRAAARRAPRPRAVDPSAAIAPRSRLRSTSNGSPPHRCTPP